MPSTRSKASRQGTETRKKSHAVTVRFGEEEFANIDGRASAAGMTLPSYIREQTVPKPVRDTRSMRRPTIDVDLAARILAQLGKVGSNINQIAKAANTTGVEIDEVKAAAAEVCEAARAVMQVLGRTA